MNNNFYKIIIKINKLHDHENMNQFNFRKHEFDL